MSSIFSRSTSVRASLAPKSRWLCGWVAVFAVGGLPSLAQVPAQIAASTPAPPVLAIPATDSTSPSPRDHADEVSIDLIARDKRKKPVDDLTSADITVTDAGNPVQLSGMHLVTAQSGGAAKIELVFDRMEPGSAKIARDAAIRLLAMAPEKCSFAVLGIDGGLRLFRNFTLDRTSTQTAIAQAMIDLPPQALTEAEQQLNSIAKTGTLPSGINADVNDRADAHLMLGALEDAQRIARDEQAPTALAALQALAKAQQSFAGRRLIVFFSSGLHANSHSVTMTKEVVEAANRAGITIYTVDTNGVDSKSFDVLTMMYAVANPVDIRMTPGNNGNLPYNDPTRVAVMGAGGVKDAYSLGDSDRRKDESNALASLSRGTGGFPISAGEDLHEPLKRLVSDISTYYEAFYTPQLKDYDGQFHAIDITPLREGVTIRAGAGYFALAPDVAGSFIVRPFEAALLKLINDSPSPTDVTFLQTVLRLGGTANQTENELALEVPVSHLELRQDDRTQLYSAHVSILAQIRDKSGVVIQRFSQDVSRNGALETIDSARAEAITLQRPFTAAPGSYVLEAAVLDGISGKSGVERTEFTIPGTSDGPWMSDIALVRRTEPLTGTSDPIEPMRYAETRVVPNLAQQVPAETPRIAFFFDIRPDTRLPGKGKLEMDVQHDGKSISHSSTAIELSAGSDSSLNLAAIDARSLVPGSYRAIFTYTQGERNASRNLDFTVEGNPAAAESSPSEPSSAAAPNADESSDASSSEAANVPSELLDLAPGRFTPSSSALRRPGTKYLNSLVESARKRALGYVDALVNFKCIEITDRFIDHKGTGTWKPHDKIAEMVTFENHQESRQVLEVNGQPGNTEPLDMKGARLEGEFGGVLKAVFSPASNAEFAWKETDGVDGAPVQVFTYRVDANHSQFSVTPLPQTPVLVGFYGLVYIDEATRGVRRITMEAENIPAKCPVRASAIAIDYDYVDINDHDYLMPVEGQLHMKLGKSHAVLNRIEFRDYHRFGSDARIVGVTPR